MRIARVLAAQSLPDSPTKQWLSQGTVKVALTLLIAFIGFLIVAGASRPQGKRGLSGLTLLKNAAGNGISKLSASFKTWLKKWVALPLALGVGFYVLLAYKGQAESPQQIFQIYAVIVVAMLAPSILKFFFKK